MTTPTPKLMAQLKKGLANGDWTTSRAVAAPVRDNKFIHPQERRVDKDYDDDVGSNKFGMSSGDYDDDVDDEDEGNDEDDYGNDVEVINLECPVVRSPPPLTPCVHT